MPGFESMKVRINHVEHELPAGSSLCVAIETLQPRPPFAVAVNMIFVPKAEHDKTMLAEGDRIEVISPVTGG